MFRILNYLVAEGRLQDFFAEIDSGVPCMDQEKREQLRVCMSSLKGRLQPTLPANMVGGEVCDWANSEITAVDGNLRVAEVPI